VQTFTKWANNHLVKKFGKDAALDDIEGEFENGEKLMQLCSALYGLPMPKYNKAPKMRPHKLDNVTMALDMLEKQAGVKTNFLKTTHLVDKDLKMILGMIWAIILHYQIQGISVEEMSAKEGLLLWCQRKTKNYNHVDPPTIRGFTTDWQNGLAFCALIHKHRPDLLDYDSLNPANARENLELAFSVAEKELGIPRLLDIEDLVDVARPDERSVITYVSEYFHCFASQGEAEGAGKRIAALVANARANDALKAQYNHDAQALRKWIVDKTAAHKARDFGDSLGAVEQKWAELQSFREHEKPPKTKEKLALEAQFATLQTKLKVQGRAPFVAPEGLAPRDIDGAWSKLNDEERARSQAIREELERQQRIKALVDRFTRRADALEQWAGSNRAYLAQSDVGSDLASVQAHIKSLDGFEADFAAAAPRLAAVKAIGAELVQLRYSGAAQIQARQASLDGAWAALRQASADRRAALEAELARQQRLEDLRVDFGKRGRVLINWVEDADILNETVHFNTSADLAEFEAQFHQFQADKAAKEPEYNALRALATEMANEGITSNVYAVYSIDDITARWQRVAAAAGSIPAALAQEKTRLKADDDACRAFAAAAAEFQQWLDAQRAAVGAVTGAPSEQITKLGELASGLASQRTRLDKIVALDNAVAQRNVLSNPHTSADVDSLKLAYDGVVATAQQQIATIEKELAKSSEQTGLSEAQMEEFKSVFKHFDSDSNNKLEKHEFKACLSGLGYSKTDDECTQILKEAGSDGASINFEQFAQVFLKLNDRSDTADSMREAFKTVAGGKQYVTEADMRAVMDNDVVTYLVANMKKEGEGYSYAEWVSAVYA
jgi:actinin alpha